MKHFAVSAPGNGQTGADARATETRAFETDGEDRMTQKGFKRFQRRKTQAVDQDTAAEVTAPQGAKPAAAPARPRPAAKPAATPVPPLELEQPSRVDIAEEPEISLPTRFDPWRQMPEVPFDFLGQKPSRLPLVSAFRSSPTARAFDLLRTRLLHSLKAHGWKRVAVTSPAAGGGTTFCAVNLALSLARVHQSRTLLMDMNFRKPGLASALGIAAHGNMADFLAGEVPIGQHMQRLSDTLAVGTNCVPDQNASEILHDRRAADVISDLIDETLADTVLFDLPPVLEHDDVTAFLPQVDGVLLISDGDQTTAAELAACEKMLAGHAPLLGVVLNRAQQTDKTQVTP
ncbi:CpsD/CapB family tyrosine-protein kinase [Pseudophaeobacter sp.]|uniref:CpsD/CapB family tyrosine-protein kinase n=1 Tax=Pseudophaeobacter sp. TaxID=1971739 RepID=UPI003299D887